MGKLCQETKRGFKQYGTLCLFILILVGVAPENDSAFGGKWPNVLLFSSIDIQYLADNVDFWRRKVGVNGFILNYLVEWWSSEEQLSGIAPNLLRLNKRSAEVGLDHNFIKVALGYKTLPHWVDDSAWKQVITTFGNIAILAKETGTRGIAIDTEAYESPIFDSSAKSFQGISKEVLQQFAFRRGHQLITALTERYPHIEVLLLQEGGYHWFISGIRKYDLWIHFYDGLASARNSQGIVLATENTYRVVKKTPLEKLYKDELDVMALHSRDPVFWRERCSIAIGMWPLGHEYWDKRSNYSVQEFQEQFETAVKLSPRYVWIYDHGAAWYRMQDSEIKKYTANGRWIWESRYQGLPTDPFVSSYYEVVRAGIVR